MDPTWIPIIGTVGGCAIAVVIVALVLHFRLEEVRMRVETEMRQMDLAYQRALESLRR
jgi:multisubunit Na+/H+ antiporter MnhB subunit